MTAASSASIHVASSGAGPDLALIHGWGLGGRIWDPLVGGLAAHFRVHVVDLPGYGAVGTEPAAADGLWDSLGDVADAVMAVLPERVSLCGWSLGGHVAIAALARHAARVNHLILCGATPCFVRKDDWPHGVQPSMLDGFETLLKLSPGRVVERFAEMINEGDVAAPEVTRHATTVAKTALPAKKSLVGGLSILRNVDWRPLANNIRHPVLIVHGELDPLMPESGANALAAMFSDARLDVFEGSAHSPFLSRPERFVTALRDFADR